MTIAVLDTGIDESHPELAGRVAGSYALDLTGRRVYPVDTPTDTLGHGTFVAGIICGRRIGIAPDARVLNCAMIPDGVGTLANFILALEWAAAQPEVRIVNISAGIRGFFPEMRAVFDGLIAVGVLPIILVGNEGIGRSRTPGNYPEAISVGASTRQGKVASFSSSETLQVDKREYSVPTLVAPGEEIFSAVAGGGYAAWNGTAMATAIVSGVAALLLEQFPDLTVDALTNVLLSSCKDLGQPPERQGHGLVQVDPERWRNLAAGLDYRTENMS